MSADDTALLRAQYTQVEGSDPEYAQGAIEKLDVAHREIARMVWLIEVEAPADVREWEKRLNTAVDARHGSFRVEPASAEEIRKVKSGEIQLQK